MDRFKEMDSCKNFDWAFRDLLSDIMIHGYGKTGAIWDPSAALPYLVDHFFDLMVIHAGQKSDAVLILKSIVDKHMQDADVTQTDCDATNPQGRERTGTSG